MKKYIHYIALALGVVLLASCEQKSDPWKSKIVDFTGQYVVTLSDDKGDVIEDFSTSNPLNIASTAANDLTSMWLVYQNGDVLLKQKMIFNGSLDNFKSTETTFDKLNNNLLRIVVPNKTLDGKAFKEATAEGQTLIVERDLVRTSILEGKILLGAATTKGGNKADSIAIKLQCYGASLTFKSVQKPQEKWALPNQPEYEWEFVSMTPSNKPAEIININGFRHTGFEEDAY